MNDFADPVVDGVSPNGFGGGAVPASVVVGPVALAAAAVYAAVVWDAVVLVNYGGAATVATTVVAMNSVVAQS